MGWWVGGGGWRSGDEEREVVLIVTQQWPITIARGISLALVDGNWIGKNKEVSYPTANWFAVGILLNDWFFCAFQKWPDSGQSTCDSQVASHYKRASPHQQCSTPHTCQSEAGMNDSWWRKSISGSHVKLHQPLDRTAKYTFNADLIVLRDECIHNFYQSFCNSHLKRRASNNITAPFN